MKSSGRAKGLPDRPYRVQGFLAQPVAPFLGALVHGYALDPPTDPSLFNLAALKDIVRSTLADIRDSASLTCAIREAEPDIAIHMAAQRWSGTPTRSGGDLRHQRHGHGAFLRGRPELSVGAVGHQRDDR